MGVDAHKHYRTPICALDFCAFLVGMLLEPKTAYQDDRRAVNVRSESLASFIYREIGTYAIRRNQQMCRSTSPSYFRAAEYVRMSTEHQQYSTENQADKIREYAAHRGIEIVRTYADAGKSGLAHRWPAGTATADQGCRNWGS